MFQEITIERLSVKSVFKLVALGLLFSVVPFFLLMGCFALFGVNTLTWNNQHVHGISALIAAPFLGVFVASGFTLFIGTSMSFGLWVFSNFKSLTVSVKQSTGEQIG